MSDKNSVILTAQRLAAKGEVDKAIEAWKSLLAETPNDGNIYNTIGDLQLKRGMQAAAIQAFLQAGTTFQSAGFALKTIAVFKKIIKLDPTRLDVVLKLADVNAERGIVGNAIEDYLKVARHELKEGHAKEAIGIYRKIAALDPTNTTIGVKLADLCQEEGLTAEAHEELSKVAACLEASGKIIELEEVRAKLRALGGAIAPNATAEESMGGASEMASTLEDLDGKSFNEATQAAELEPPRVYEPTASPDAALVPQLDLAAPIEEVPLAQCSSIEPPVPLARPTDTIRLRTTSEYDETTADRLRDALTEADVYLKYGMPDKAITHLQGWIQQDPSNVTVLTKLKDVYRAQGDAKRAAEQCLKIADLYQHLGQDAERESAVREAMAIDPEGSFVERYAANRDAERHVSASSEPSVQAAPSAPAEPVQDMPSDAAPSDAAPSDTATAETLDQDLAEADFYFQQGFDDEARKLFLAILDKHPDHPTASQRVAELAERAERAAVPPEVLPPAVEGVVEPVIEPEIASVVEPVAELSLGPEQSMTGLEMTALDTTQVNDATKVEDYIDLADALREDMEDSLPPEEAELSQELSAERELEGVFRRFQKGVQEQYGEEDYETHYNLGMAYREMGLLNEAIGEFRLVVKSPDRRVPATIMLATCYREKGLLPRGEEVLRALLDEPEIAKVEGVGGLVYELGQNLEMQDRYDEAVAQFRRVKELEPGHKSATAKVVELERWLASGASRRRPPAESAKADLVKIRPKSPAATTVSKPLPREKEKKKVSYL